MSSQAFNYKHLHYFWVVAKEGGIARGAERLGLAVQTVSSQVRELESDLGYALFKPQGRGLQLTEAGEAALALADRIFQLGEQLPQEVHDAATQSVLRLNVGLSDGLPKLVVRRLLQPVLSEPNLRLSCHEDRFDDLLATLALHRLDIVLADRLPSANPNLKLYSHSLGSSALVWYAPARWSEAAARDFPRSLADVPLLLPTAHAATREQLDQWLASHSIKPRIVGEFEDSALLKTFGASGMGVFPAAQWVHEELTAQYGVTRVGECEGVQQQFYAIGYEKQVQHPLVQKLLPRF